MNKQILTKSVLRQLIKEEVAKQTEAAKQTKLNENLIQFIMDNPESLAGLMAFLGIGAATTNTAIDKFKASKSDNEQKSILKRAFSAISGAAGDTTTAIYKTFGGNR
jgi:hypothetical protein